jgi:hypothetical protein
MGALPLQSQCHRTHRHGALKPRDVALDSPRLCPQRLLRARRSLPLLLQRLKLQARLLLLRRTGCDHVFQLASDAEQLPARPPLQLPQARRAGGGHVGAQPAGLCARLARNRLAHRERAGGEASKAWVDGGCGAMAA